MGAFCGWFGHDGTENGFHVTKDTGHIQPLDGGYDVNDMMTNGLLGASALKQLNGGRRIRGRICL